MEKDQIKEEVELKPQQNRQQTKLTTEIFGDMEHKDVFRTLLMIYRTDNYIPIQNCAKFVVELMSKPCLGPQADQRLYIRIRQALDQFSKDGKTLREKEFCQIMTWLQDCDQNKKSLQEEYDIFLVKLFHSQKNTKSDCISIDSKYISQESQNLELKTLIQKSGFRFEESQFKQIVQSYFRNKTQIKLQQFKLFAKGQCVKLTKPKLKPYKI